MRLRRCSIAFSSSVIRHIPAAHIFQRPAAGHRITVWVEIPTFSPYNPVLSDQLVSEFTPDAPNTATSSLQYRQHVPCHISCR